MKDFFPSTSEYDLYYPKFSNYQSIKDLLDISPIKYTLSQINNANKKQDITEFNIASRDKVRQYIKNLESILREIDSVSTPLYQKMIGLRLRAFFFSEYNNNNFYDLFSDINEDLYISVDVSKELYTKPNDYLYYCILLVSCMNNDILVKSKSFSEYIKYLKDNLAISIKSFMEPHDGVFDFPKGYPNLFYEKKRYHEIESLCEYTATYLFPKQLSDCLHWPLESTDYVFSSLLSFKYYNHIALQFINILLTKLYLIPVTYEYAVEVGTFMLTNIKRCFFSHFEERDRLPNELFAGNNHLDGLMYTFNNVLNKCIYGESEFEEITKSTIEIYAKYLSYLLDCENNYIQKKAEST